MASGLPDNSQVDYTQTLGAKMITPGANPDPNAGKTTITPASNQTSSSTQIPSTAQDKLNELNAQPPKRTKKKVEEPTVPTNVQGTDEEDIQQTTNVSQTLTDFFSKIKVSTGLGFAFVFLVLLIWMLIPTASGETRMKLLWYTLIGKSKLVHPVDHGTGTDNTSSTTSTPVTLSTPAVLPSSGPDQSQLVGVNGNGYVPYIDTSAMDLFGID